MLLRQMSRFLDTKLSFLDNLKAVFEETHKTIELLCKLVLVLPRSSLLIIYKSFVRLHLDYGGIIYDKAFIRKWKPCSTTQH